MFGVLDHLVVEPLDGNDENMRQIDKIKLLQSHQGLAVRTRIIILSLGKSLLLKKGLHKFRKHQRFLVIPRVL
jgi:hypothetical protein